jgi:hypothetical protein
MVLHNCKLDSDVEQVQFYLIKYLVILKIEGDIMQFVKIVNVTFPPTKLNKNCIISPSILRIRSIQLSKLVLSKNQECSYIEQFFMYLMFSLSKNDLKVFVRRMLFALEFFDASRCIT